MNTLSAIHLLIVEDQADQRRLLELYFTSVGYKVFTAAGAFDALRLFGENPITVILSDNDLGSGLMQGFEFLRIAKTTRPQTLCILMSGLQKPPRYDGIFLGKPVEMAQIRVLIEALCAKTA